MISLLYFQAIQRANPATQNQCLASKFHHSPHQMIQLHTVNRVDDCLWQINIDVFPNRRFRQLYQTGFWSLAPLDAPDPSKAALTFFKSLPLSGRADNSAFLLVPPCTCTSTSDSYKFGTSVFTTILAFAAISFLSA